MTYNLFIAYDLMRPGQNYEAVQSRIKELGLYYQFQMSLFYVNTIHPPAVAYYRVAQAIDTSDRLAVINAVGGIVSNWDHPPIDEINAIWTAP